MEQIVRLQGLPKAGTSGDIRRFFSGLAIPKGGVHILGGQLGEAFVIFQSPEDAQTALRQAGGDIKNSAIQIFLSSKAEMEHTIDIWFGAKRPGPGLEKVKKPVPKAKNAVKETKQSKEEESVYLFLVGLPYSVTTDDIRKFFHGLHVVDIILLKNSKGLLNGNGLVKFGSVEDANSGLLRNKKYIGPRFISIRRTNEEKWINSGGLRDKTHDPIHEGRARSPNQHNYSEKRSRSLEKPEVSPKKLNTGSLSTVKQFYIHLKNIHSSVEKHDIKNILGDPAMSDSQIKFLNKKQNEDSKEGFVMLQNESQYEKCLGLNGIVLVDRPLFILPIARKAMLDLIESSEAEAISEEEKNAPKHSGIKRYVYLRNLPFDVNKREVWEFFAGLPVIEEDIVLLYDDKGVGLGEALVTFPSEEEAIAAERLNNQMYLGTEVLLMRISEEEKTAFNLNICPPVPYREQIIPPARRDDLLESVHLQDQARHSLSDLWYRSEDFRFPPLDPRGPYYRDSMEDELFWRFNEAYRMRYRDEIPSQSFVRRSAPATIHLKNLQPSTTAEDILNFFYGYRVIPESVIFRIIQTKKRGPLVKATVCLESHEEAMAAVRELQDKPIGDSKVRLTLIQ
ncbi:RNA-binding protein 12B [Bombina bombina]|uniref:RNA-binding protein 12B n=1 Tax=Bombina bombina TaxID=8345 RepID=UPI00235AB4E4|nr:RNA-binding protein 12B [Bombina bombina]